jgi:hypothetical protein
MSRSVDRPLRGSYRALPSKRRCIAKADGRQRPLGIAALEDKIVQRALVEARRDLCGGYRVTGIPTAIGGAR